MTQSQVVTRLVGRGFTPSHQRSTDRVYLWKRDWLGQTLAEVSPDGSVNGGTLKAFLEGVKL